LKVFVKDEPISNAWKLLDGGNVQLKIEGNKSGKKETANRGGCTTFKKHVFGSQEKNYCGMKLRSYKRWRDLLE
jgi:hypothetical protein